MTSFYSLFLHFFHYFSLTYKGGNSSRYIHYFGCIGVIRFASPYFQLDQSHVCITRKKRKIYMSNSRISDQTARMPGHIGVFIQFACSLFFFGSFTHTPPPPLYLFTLLYFSFPLFSQFFFFWQIYKFILQ